MAKSSKEYMHAPMIADALNEIPATPEGLQKLHELGARCQWCQSNLDSWLLMQIFKKLRQLEPRLQQIEAKQGK